MTAIQKAYYQNGRFGDNCASVGYDDSEFYGRGYYFCNGYGDPWACKTQIEAEAMMTHFLDDKKPAFQPKDWHGRDFLLNDMLYRERNCV